MRKTNLLQGTLAFTAVALLLIGVAVAQPRTPSNAAQWLPITGTNWAFSVPAGWRNLQPPAAAPPSMIVSSIAAPRAARGNFPNVNLVIEPFSAGDGVAYGRAALASLQQIATVLNSRPAPVGNLRGFEIQAQWPNNQPPTQSLQRIAVSQGFAHVLTCSDTVEAFARSAAVCQRVAASFRVR